MDGKTNEAWKLKLMLSDLLAQGRMQLKDIDINDLMEFGEDTCNK